MEQNIEDKVPEPIGQDGLDHPTLGRLKSPSNKVVKVHPRPSYNHNDFSNSSKYETSEEGGL